MRGLTRRGVLVDRGGQSKAKSAVDIRSVIRDLCRVAAYCVMDFVS